MTKFGAYEEEVEISPGIYLTKKKQSPEDEANARLEKTLKQLEGDPKAHLEFLKDQITRTKKAIEQLEYSNREMFNADPEDPVYVEAIAENRIIIERQKRFIQEFQKKATQVATTLGVCLQDQFTYTEPTGDKSIVIDESGAYL